MTVSSRIALTLKAFADNASTMHCTPVLRVTICQMIVICVLVDSLVVDEMR